MIQFPIFFRSVETTTYSGKVTHRTGKWTRIVQVSPIENDDFSIVIIVFRAYIKPCQAQDRLL